MVGWEIQINLPKNGFEDWEKTYVHYKSANDSINAIKQKIEQLFEENEEVSIYIEDYDTDRAVKFNFSGDKADIYEKVTDVTQHSIEDARKILKEEYSKIREKAKEISM